MVKSWILFLLVQCVFLLNGFCQNLPSPKNDGWHSEALSSEIETQLSEIISRTKKGLSLENLIREDARITALDLEKLTELRNDGQVSIQKWSEDVSEEVPFSSSFAHMIGVGEELSTYKFKIKISQIKISPEQAEARVIFHASVPRDHGALQINSIWKTHWSTVTGEPILSSLELLNYDNTLLKSPRPWFNDATSAIFGDDDAFQNQVSIGMNQWLNRIERFAGSNIYSRHGMAMGDANGDGRDDVYLCQPGGLPNRLFLQQDDGTLRDASAVSGLDWLNDTRSALFIDLDNDGDQDIVLGTFVGSYICRNNGAGVFEVAAQLEGVDRDISSLTAADYDQDGYVDIYVCAYESEDRLDGIDQSGHSVYDLRSKGGVNRLFRNLIGESKEYWQFKDVTSSTGLNVGNERFSLAAAWEDYDNDGDQDLYIANDFGLNCLYENSDGHFEEVSQQLGVQDYSPGMSATWGDLNRDGNHDLYVGNMFSSAGNRVTRQEQFNHDYEGVTLDRLVRFNRGNSLYINNGKGFREELDGLGAQNALWAWSSLLGDIDNDGWEDILCANGYITGPGSGDL